jgi:hypothetical protein
VAAAGKPHRTRVGSRCMEAASCRLVITPWGTACHTGMQREPDTLKHEVSRTMCAHHTIGCCCFLGIILNSYSSRMNNKARVSNLTS